MDCLLGVIKAEGSGCSGGHKEVIKYAFSESQLGMYTTISILLRLHRYEEKLRNINSFSIPLASAHREESQQTTTQL